MSIIMAKKEKTLAEHLSEIGRKGGQSTSEAKTAAVKRNLEKAQVKRWPAKKELAQDKDEC